MLRTLLLLPLTACLGFGDDPAAVLDSCGDAVVDRDEECDDGNTTGGDGCSAACTLEDATPRCGDAILDPGEQCDDGNTTNGDGCSSTCATETTPKRRTISQTTSDQIIVNNSAACRDGSTGVTRQNAWFRRFVPADHAITTAFTIEEVAFGIEEATAGSGTTQPATLRIHAYNAATAGDTLDTTAMVLLAESPLVIANTGPAIVARPIAATVPAGRPFVVEVFVPEGTTAGHRFRIGTNQAGEQRVGYFAAPTCGYSVPTNLPAVVTGRPIHLVMNVTGTIQ